MKRFFCEDNTYAVIARKVSSAVNTAFAADKKQVYIGDVEDAVRSLIIGAEGKDCVCCYGEHFTSYYLKKLRSNQIIKF